MPGMDLFTMRRKEIVFVLLVGSICVGLFFLPTGFEGFALENSQTARARVLEADNADVRQTMIIKTGSQQLTIEVLNGPFKGQRTVAANPLSGKLEMDEFYGPGDEMLVEFAVSQDQKIEAAYARGHYRLNVELVLVGLFALLLVGVAGWTGVKAIVSFVFAALMLWKVLVPLFLLGEIKLGTFSVRIDPIVLSLAVSALLTGAICFLVGGLNRKGLTTFCGAFLGLVLTGLLAMYFTNQFKIHGSVRPFSEMLLYSGNFKLDLTRIFISSVFIASSGAVMDLAMDIAAAMDEVKQKKPGIQLGEHIVSGFRVGRHVVGTMTTTLLLAYSGGYIFLLMFMMGRQIPLPIILNKSLIAAEILNTLVGSFGLVTVAPFTAIAGGVIYHGFGRKQTPASCKGAEHAAVSSAA